jgi:hypothetical protein
MPQEKTMARVHLGWQACLVAVVAIGLGIGSACKKEDGKGGAAGGGGGALSGAVDDLSLLPVDSEVVVGINFAQVQSSSLWKTFVAPKLASGDMSSKLKEFKDLCNMDPMTSIKSVSVGAKSNSGKDEVVAVLHGLDKGKMAACLDNAKIKEMIAKDGGEYSKDGDVHMFKGKKGAPAGLLFLNDDTAIMVSGENVTAASVKAASSGDSALKTSKGFVDMYSKVKTSDSLWFFVNSKSSMLAKVPGDQKPSALFGSFNVADGLSVDVRARFDAPDAAKKLAETAKGQLPQLQAFVKLDKSDVDVDGNDLKVSIAMSAQNLAENLKSLAPMMGGM